MSERLQLKKEPPPPEIISCPGCGKPLAGDAVICVQCGYDTRTGRRVGEAGKPKLSPVLILGIVLVIVGAGVSIYLRSQDDGVVPTPPPASVQPEVASQQDAVPAEVAQAEATSASATASETESEPTSAAPAEGETASASTEMKGDATTSSVSTEPPEPEIDWEEIAARQRERIETEMNRRVPMFAVGSLVEFRLTNGLVRRGIFEGADDQGAHLKGEAGEKQVVPIESLDRNTRLRIDKEYRTRYFDYLTRQRVAELKRAHAAGEPK